MRESSYQCERCADADVVRWFNYPRAFYANCLLSVLESKCELRPVVGSAGMNAVQITEQRLRAIMRPESEPHRLTQFVAAVVLGFVLLPGAALVVNAESIVPVHEFNPDLPPDFKCWSVEDSE